MNHLLMKWLETDENILFSACCWNWVKLRIRRPIICNPAMHRIAFLVHSRYILGRLSWLFQLY